MSGGLTMGDAKFEHLVRAEVTLIFCYGSKRPKLFAGGFQILLGSRNYLKWSQTGVSLLYYLFSVVCDQLPFPFSQDPRWDLLFYF